MSLQTLIYHNTQLIFRAEDGLLHVPDAQSVLLWQALRTGISPTEICQATASAIQQAACLAHLQQLQQQWQALGLLDAEPEPQGEYVQWLQPAREVICVSTDDPRIHHYLQQAYQACQLTPAQRANHYLEIKQNPEQYTYQVLINGKTHYSNLDFDQTLINICYAIGELATHEEPRLLVLHAAALRWHDKVWLFPAQAGSGKSTLAANLLQHGATLINDDIVPLNHDGTLSTLQQPLKIKSGAWQVLEPLYSQLTAMPALKRPDGLIMKHLGLPHAHYCRAGAKQNVDYLVVPEYSPQAAQAQRQTLDAVATLQALLAAEPYFPHQLTRAYLENILAWLQGIPGYKITYRDSAEALALLSNL